MHPTPVDAMPPQRVAAVTGGNKGIGFCIVKLLCQKFDGDVYLTARNEELGHAAVLKLNKLQLYPKFHQLDISCPQSIQKFREYLKKNHGGLDVLINNAAIMYRPESTTPVAEQAEVTLKTNFFGTLNMCTELFPLLREHARVVNVTSEWGMLKMIKSQEIKKKFNNPNITLDELCDLMRQFVKDAKECEDVKEGGLDDWGNGSWSTAYHVSKVGVSVLTFIQQREFNEDARQDLVVNAVNPGFVITDMTGNRGHITADQGADAPTYLALLPPNIKSPKGEFVWYDRKVVPWDEE